MPESREPWVVRVVRGDATGVGPALLRLVLTPLSVLFGALAETRGMLYRSGVLTRHRVSCPVVSVGNLTVGGTGKTPLVEWVVKELRVRGWRPVVLSRGYGAREDEVPDELALLAESLPGFRAVRDPDRVRGALTAIEVHCADALVLDDGFQHHRLARQMDLVAVDATAPFGGGHCLPRGTLREPVRALRRADVVVVTRSDQVPPEFLDRVLRRVRRAAPRAAVATAVHRPDALAEVPSATERPLAWLLGRRVFAVSGIGNPAAFERTLADLGAVLAGGERYSDHHHYGAEALAGISRRAAEAGAEAVVTTHKDAVKWKSWPAAGPAALCLTVRIAFTSGEEEVRARLRHALP